MKLNTYGYKMFGLKKAAGATKNLLGYYHGLYIQLSYNPKTGKIGLGEHFDFSHRSRDIYIDPNYIDIANLYEPYTMQEIADLIVNKMKEREFCCEFYNETA